MRHATYIEKDQNWADGSTTYWFYLDGEQYGIVEGENAGPVDVDGHPIDYNEDLRVFVVGNCIVNDEMRLA